MAPAVAAADDNDSRTTTINKHYNISLVINLKRGKDEIELADKEMTRLHQLIAGGTEADWAKNQVSSIHRMVFVPDTEQIKNELTSKLEEADQAPASKNNRQ